MLQIQGEQVIRHQWLRNDRNPQGALVPVYQDVLVEDVGVDVASADEPRNMSAERDVVERVLFLPPGMTVNHLDQFTVYGQRFGVEGFAPPVRNFFTASTFRTEVKLKRVTG